MSNKYYWLKLKKDFFKQHEIMVVEAMPNGKDYVLFYLKLMAESVSHNGDLRFADTIPYNAEMLAALTNTNVDIVRSAIKVFEELEMLEVLDDGTIFMREVQSLIGSETAWAEKKRLQRGQKGDNVPQLSDKSIENRDKSIENRNNNNILVQSTHTTQYAEEFEKLWKTYPKKQGKTDAFNHFKAARKKGVTYEEIENGLNRYLAYIKSNHIETKYIKNGSTWFNKCWEDDYEVEGTNFKDTKASYDSEKYRQMANAEIVYKPRHSSDDVPNVVCDSRYGVF